MKERRSREDYDLEPQAEQEEEMKKYSESKKTGSRDGERSAGRARGVKVTKKNTLDTGNNRDGR